MAEQQAMTSDSLKPQSSSWLAEHLSSLLEGLPLEGHLPVASEIVRKRRALDLQITRGAIFLRITVDKTRPVRVRFSMPVLTPQKWERLLLEMASSSLYLGKLLIGEVPAQLLELARRIDVELFPMQLGDIAIQCDCTEATCDHVAVLYLLLAERLERDPVSFLLFRGMERDQVAQRLREIRRERLPQPQASTAFSYRHVPYDPTPPLQGEVERFWSAGSELHTLSYTIRADDLPASLLRRLDPVPLNEGNTEVELLLEELYAQVARRAQALGLGLS